MKKIVILLAIISMASMCRSPQLREHQTNNVSAEDNMQDDQFFAEDAKERKEEKLIAKENVAIQIEDQAGKSNGYAAWYGKELQGKPTASGELFDMRKYTAAHRDFPMGSIVLVKNTENNKKQLVRINDRGPYVDGRIIDVSYATARDLGFAEKGVAKVEIELIRKGNDDFMSKAQDLEKEPVETEDEGLEDEPEERKSAYTFVDGMKPSGFTVQVGAFKRRANAERQRAEMEDEHTQKGFIASKGRWHYVWLGDFKSKSKAKKFIKKLKARGVQAIYRGNPI